MRRLGIVVSGTCVRAAAVSGETTVWMAERPLAHPSELKAALAELVAEVPRQFRRVRVGLDADLAQAKVLHGLPPLSARRLRQAIQLHAGRWFLRNGSPLVTDVVRQRHCGLPVAAAADEATLEAIASGLAEARLRLDTIAPLSLILPAASSNGSDAAPNGRGVGPVQISEGEVVSIRRTEPAAATERDADRTALVARRRPLLNLRPPRLVLKRIRRRSLIARNLLVAAAVVWLVAGATWTLRLTSQLWSERARLSSAESQLAAAARLQGEIAAAEAAIALLATARRDRSRTVELLRDITAALPDSAFLVSFRLGAGGVGTIAGLAPSAAAVLRRLRETKGFAGARIEGPIMRDRPGDGVTRERFAIRLEPDAEGRR